MATAGEVYGLIALGLLILWVIFGGTHGKGDD